MAINRKLITDADFEEALQRELRLRVFENDYIVCSGGNIVRFDDTQVVIQTSVSDITYFSREQCEFFEMKRK